MTNGVVNRWSEHDYEHFAVCPLVVTTIIFKVLGAAIELLAAARFNDLVSSKLCTLDGVGHVVAVWRLATYDVRYLFDGFAVFFV